MRVRISATPPPTAVELIFWIDTPRSRSASIDSSSMVEAPTMGI